MTDVQIYKNELGAYLPITGPWPSDYTKRILDAAKEIYQQCIDDGVEYVQLIASSHWATEGYWVTTQRGVVEHPDFVVLEFDKLKQDTQ